MSEVNVGNYNIIIEKNTLSNITKYVDFSKFSKVMILTDENLVKCGWLEKLTNTLPIETKVLAIKSGEENKNLSTVENIWKNMNDNGLDRKSILVNLGGGVVSDMGGFCASTYMRGIKFLNIPTTLLSQVDASVGGKTGFDFNGFKNIVGSFAEPYKVIIDTNTFETLSKREFNSGMGEVIKTAIIYDADFFNYLENEEINMEQVVQKCCEIKADVVKKDFKEGGLRQILNFGHTIGHAVESLSLKTDKPLLHGEAVAIGMVAVCYIANKIGKISNEELDRVKNILKKYELPIFYETNNPSLDLDLIYLALFKDKKTIGQKIKFVLPNSIGSCEFGVELNEDLIKDGIKQVLSVNKLLELK